ncbi:hypothetical protein BCD67_16120 [Oscillatoriales cyanobacterium USR001]|nr:hypothetical protein BCD67_16120 [Oscillatoriales cyanobacterium USR001]
MYSFQQNSPETQPSQGANLVIPSDLLVSCATVPLLFGILSARAAAELMVTIGSVSEEVFRGDRLPVLNFPHN